MFLKRQFDRKYLTALAAAAVLLPVAAFAVGYLAGPRATASVQDIDAQAGAGAGNDRHLSVVANFAFGYRAVFENTVIHHHFIGLGIDHAPERLARCDWIRPAV